MLNKCEFIGNLGRDAEIRTMQNGNRVANLSIGVTEKWKDKNSGERRERTEWVRVVIFNDGLVDVVEKYTRKGSKIYVSGKMQTREWEQDGVKKYTTEIVLQNFQGTVILLDNKSDSQQDETPKAEPAAADLSDIDDDIPFD